MSTPRQQSSLQANRPWTPFSGTGWISYREQLHALSPDMAEAISAAAHVVRIHGGNPRECFVRLVELDDKLREIERANDA